MRSEVPPALAAARSSYRPAAKAPARIAELLPLHPRTDPPCSHRRRVALEGTSSPYTAMSTSGQGAVLDRMDTTSHPSPGSQGDEPPPPPGPRDEAGAADGGNRPGARHPAAFAPWPLWSGCRWLCRSRPALSVTTRWGLRLLRTRATSAGGVLLLTHARAGVDTEVESSALSSWSPAAQGGAVAAERVGVEFRESRFFFSATGSSFSEVRASSST